MNQRPQPSPASPAAAPWCWGRLRGNYVARGLGRTGATIVNPTNFMLYTPLLPEAAAGTIEPRHVLVPIRAMCPHADLLLGSAVALDPERRIVQVESDAGRFTVTYSDLVVALGSVSHLPPVPGLREHALALKDLADAIRLRNHVLRQIELADADPDSAAGSRAISAAPRARTAPARAARWRRSAVGTGSPSPGA